MQFTSNRLERLYTYEEISKHTLETNIWDVTNFIQTHPGGPEILLKMAGTNVTKEFTDIGHSDVAKNYMRQFYIGKLDTNSKPVTVIPKLQIRDDFEKCVKNMEVISNNVDERLKLLEKKEREILLLQETMRIKVESNARALPDRILFNVGGKKFATTKSTVLKHQSFFSGFLDSDIKPDKKGYYFIDRSPKYFAIVLDYLRDGTIDFSGYTKPETDSIYKEFEYYLISLPSRK